MCVRVIVCMRVCSVRGLCKCLLDDLKHVGFQNVSVIVGNDGYEGCVSGYKVMQSVR